MGITKSAKIAFLSVSLFILFAYCRVNRKNIKEDFFTANYYRQNIHDISELSYRIRDFYNAGIIYNPDIDLYIEKDYFSKNKFINSNFSKGLEHWATTGIGQEGRGSTKNLLEICNKDYVSPLYCLKVTAFEYPCRVFYTKRKNKNFIVEPWDFRNSKAWMGVRPGEAFQISYWWKNTLPVVTINILELGSSFRILKRVASNEKKSGWRKEQFIIKIPEDGRAIMIEIQLASGKPGAVMYLDDINIAPLKNKKDINS